MVADKVSAKLACMESSQVLYHLDVIHEFKHGISRHPGRWNSIEAIGYMPADNPVASSKKAEEGCI